MAARFEPEGGPRRRSHDSRTRRAAGKFHGRRNLQGLLLLSVCLMSRRMLAVRVTRRHVICDAGHKSFCTLALHCWARNTADARGPNGGGMKGRWTRPLAVGRFFGKPIVR